MAQKGVVFLWVFLTWASTFAAVDSLSAKTQQKASYTPKATIKINPTCLVNTLRASLFFASDIWLTKHVVVEPGLGWFFDSPLYTDKGESFNGVRARLGLKYMILAKGNKLPFIGLEGKYNYIFQNTHDELCRYGCQYTELLSLQRTYNTAGLAVKAGAQFHVLKNRRMVFEVYGGLGFKYTEVKLPLPPDAESLEFAPRHPTISEAPEPGKHYLFDMLLGINLGYLFVR